MRQKYKNNCKYPYIILFLFKKYLFKHEAVTHIPFFNPPNHPHTSILTYLTFRNTSKC